MAGARNGREIRASQHSADGQAEDLSDGAASQAVRGRLKRGARLTMMTLPHGPFAWVRSLHG